MKRNRIDRLCKFLPRNWLDEYTQEEIDQEILIAQWKSGKAPKESAFLAIQTLMWRSYREARKLRGWSRVELSEELEATPNMSEEWSSMESLIRTCGESWVAYLLLVCDKKGTLSKWLELSPSELSRWLLKFKTTSNFISE